MTFVRLFGDSHYYHWDKDKMKLYNFHNGWRTIDENSEQWMNAWLIEADDWHDLYIQTGYCPLFTDSWRHDVWVDTEGNFYEGDGHSLCAEKICEVLFGYDENVSLYDPSDCLIDWYGWIKLTTSPMLTYYLEDGLYDHITQEQVNAIKEWSNKNGIVLFDKESWA